MKSFSKLKLKKCLLLLIVFFIVQVGNPHFAFSQSDKNGSLEHLTYCNGFQNLALGGDARRIPGFKLAYMDNDDTVDQDSCIKFEYKDEDMLNIGNGVFLNLIGIRTYKNKIVDIYLFFFRDDGHKILKAFLAAYGKTTGSEGDFMYDWKTSLVNLSLRYQYDVDMGVAVFSCNDLENKIKADKTKRLLLQSQLLTGLF